MSDTVKVVVELSETQAWAWAQFLKCVDLDTYQEWAADRDEAYQMLDAGEKVRRAFAEAGYAPRCDGFSGL